MSRRASTPRRASSKAGSPAPTKFTSSVPSRATALPDTEHRNTLLKLNIKLAPVKTQVLELDAGPNILICRVKVPTPKGVSGHLIRRCDSDAISASSLFRVAFPTASTTAEAREMDYLTSRFDTKRAGMDHDVASKLTGTWIPTESAMELADEYGLDRYLSDLITFDAKPALAAMPATPAKSTAVKPAAATPASTKSATAASAKKPPSSNRSSLAATDAAAVTPSRASKRARVTSPGPTPAVTVVQTKITDEATGETTERIEVGIAPTIDATASYTDDNVTAALNASKELVDTLREAGTLTDGSSSKKRGRDAMETEGTLILQPLVLAPAAGRRRLWAAVGATALAAASVAAPYFFQ